MTKEQQKRERRLAVTSRYTSQEIEQLDWFAERVGCDRANAPRMFMAAYLTTCPDLMEDFYQSGNESAQRKRYLREEEQNIQAEEQ